MANWFIGDEIVSVKATLSNRGHKTVEVEDTAEGFIEYKNGATLGFWVMNNYGYDEPIEIRLYCENGVAIMDYDHATITYKDGTVVTDATDMDNQLTYDGGDMYLGFQHIRQIADFYKSIENDEEPYISGKEALKIQKLICDIYKGYNTKTK